METQPAPRAPEEPESTETHAAAQKHDLFWVFAGEQGLRSGWAAMLFVALFYLITFVLDTVAVTVDPALASNTVSARSMLVGELLPVLAIAAAGLFVSRVQERRLLDYNLRGRAPGMRFAAGAAAGFAALTVLVGVEALGGWLRFGPETLHGAAAAKYAAIWAVDFLLVGLFEEGSFRCVLLATLERGMTFAWALATVAGACLVVSLRPHAQGTGGVYLFAVLGAIPCLLAARRASGGFWQAAWATSTIFGAYHTSNHGEMWIGIFTASAIGWVFCVSVRVTGSAWWAIGCHAAWDWAETYFYGTANSGFAAPGHLFTSTAHGNVLLSGGAAGPEGSVLAVPATALLLGLALLVYGRRRGAMPTAAG